MPFSTKLNSCSKLTNGKLRNSRKTLAKHIPIKVSNDESELEDNWISIVSEVVFADGDALAWVRTYTTRKSGLMWCPKIRMM